MNRRDELAEKLFVAFARTKWAGERDAASLVKAAFIDADAFLAKCAEAADGEPILWLEDMTEEDSHNPADRYRIVREGPMEPRAFAVYARPCAQPAPLSPEPYAWTWIEDGPMHAPSVVRFTTIRGGNGAPPYATPLYKRPSDWQARAEQAERERAEATAQERARCAAACRAVQTRWSWHAVATAATRDCVNAIERGEGSE